jgi:nudix motif 8
MSHLLIRTRTIITVASRRSRLQQAFNNSSSSNNNPQLQTTNRVWKASTMDSTDNDTTLNTNIVAGEVWTDRVIDKSSESLGTLLARIESQESGGARLRSRQRGVLHDDPATDMQLLTTNYTVAAVASALRDREDVLQQAAVFAEEGRFDELQSLLSVFHPKYVLQRRESQRHWNITKDLSSPHSLEIIRKALMRRPRTVSQAHARRAAVVIPLCTVNGCPSLLLEKRAAHIRAHPDEVCLPGGMVCTMNDQTIVATCLREMQEEIGGLDHDPQVLGVFRCNWGEVHHLVGVAVTPVVCFLGELPDHLEPNAGEVAEVFTIPLHSLLDKHLWVHKEGLAPVFLGGPHVIWGLTGYILDRFHKDILLPNSRADGDDMSSDL